MGQGWKRLPLLVVFLLFWKNTDGFKGGAYSNAHQRWGQPSDTSSPHAVQSSMSEARVTGTLPVEEVGSSLFSNKPLKSRSKFNLLQFVKGGSSSSQSTSHAQTAPGSSVSAFLPLPLDEQPLSSSTSAGSSISGAASGLSLQTLYAASGSGHLVSTQGGSSSYPAKLGVSDQSTSDGLHLSTSQETSVHKSAEASLPVFSQESISYSSSSAPGATATSQSSPILPESWGQRVSSQGEDSYSALSQGASSPYTPGSLMSNKLDALPLGVSSQATSSGSSYRAVSQVGSLPQVGASDQFASRRGNHYSGLLPQSQATSSQGHIDYSKPVSSPQSTSSQSAGVWSPRKQYASASQGSSRAQFGASTGFTSQGMSGSVPSQGTTSQFAPGSPSPYDSLYCKCALSPQGVDRESTTVQSSHKQFTSRYGTESGSSTPFTLQGSIAYDRSPRPQGTASQLGPVSHSYPSVSSSSQGVASQSTTVQFPRKQLASTYTGSSGTQAGSSPPFTLQGSTAYGGSPEDAASPFAPGYESSYGRESLSSSPAGPSTTVQGSLKQFTSTFTGGSGTQAGSSPPFTLQGSTAYGGSPEDAASPFAPGYESSYGRESLSSSPAGPSTTVQGSLKQFTSTFTGGSGTQAGSSTPFTLQGSTAYGGSSQPQDAASQLVRGSYPYASVSHSSPHAGPSTTVQGSLKQFTSTFTGGSGTQAGSSPPFTLQGSTAYGGSPEDAASPFAPGYESSYGRESLSSSPAGPSTTVQGSLKQFTSTFTGGSGTQAGSSTPFTLQGSTAYGGSSQPQDAASQLVRGSYPYASVSHSSPHAGPSTTVQGSLKQFTSTFTGGSGTQAGSSTPFTLQGSTAYGGSSQPQDAASQLVRASYPYASVSHSSPHAGPSTTVQGSLKQFTSTFTGGSGTQAGSSPPFTLQGSTAYGGSPEDAASPFAPGYESSYGRESLSSSPAGPSTTVQGSLKQFTSTFTGGSGTQAGSSPPFTLQGSTAYGGSPEDAASPFAPGYESSYGRESLSSSPAGPSTTVQGSLKQFTSTFTGGSGTQAGSSTPFTLQGSTAYGGSSQPQDAASQLVRGSYPYASVSHSSPHAGPSTTVQGSLKQFTSTFTGGSGTQAGSSTPFTLQGSTAYGGSSQPQDAASQLVRGSYPYTRVSLSSPQGAASQSSQSYQGASASQSRESQKWQPSATHLTPVIRTSDATASQGSSPTQFSSLSSAGGSSRVSGQFVSAHGGSSSYGGSLQSQSLSTKYTPGFQHLPYDTSVAGQGTSSASASEVSTSYSSMNKQNAPAQAASTRSRAKRLW